MESEEFRITIDPQKINNDITLYQSVMLELFDKCQMQYTISNFYSFVDNNNIDIVRNTFYNNRYDIEKGYSNFLYKRCDKKMSLAVDMYYLRLESYLLSVSKFQISESQKDGCKEKTTGNDFFSRLFVTKNFFPLYIALISSNSKNANWVKMAESIKTLYKYFFAPYEHGQLIGNFGTLNYEKAHKLYTYWLDLLLPNKLYGLISKVEKTLAKESNQPTELALKYNLNLFINEISRTTYFSKTIQNEFLNYANYIFDEFCKNRKKGISYIADSSTNNIPSIKAYIADDLIKKISIFKYKLDETSLTPISITKTGK